MLAETMLMAGIDKEAEALSHYRADTGYEILFIGWIYESLSDACLDKQS